MATKAPPPREPHLGASEARIALIEASKRVLETVKTLPKEYAYRDAIHKLYTFRLKIAQEESDTKKIESLIQGGEINEMIRIANEEINLIPKLVENKPWDLSDDVDFDTTDPDWVPFERKIYVN